jgi:hypothetical protein
VTLAATASSLFKRWFGAGARNGADAAGARAWAEAQGHRFATTRDAEGFVIESTRDAAWRAEWGPSQRDYIAGMELRVRAEVGEVPDLQMLAMSRFAAKLLEQEVFEQYTEGNQTRMDDRTPEEMRWLVLHEKMPRSALGALREHFIVLANRPAAAPMWLDGALGEQLATATQWLAERQTLALVVQRGRFVLRLGAAEATPELLHAAIGLASVAAAAARRVAAEVARGAVGSERPSTWGAPSAMPPDERGL